jgi:hypothetical protein
LHFENFFKTTSLFTKLVKFRPYFRINMAQIAPEISDNTILKPEPTLVFLAERAHKLAQQLQSQVTQPPTFQNDTLAELPAEVEDIRLALIDAANDLTMLARGAGGPFGRVQTVSNTYVCCCPPPRWRP